jgi:UDP-glucose 4-epimerase
MANILVAGGAGYIGAHTCLDLFNKGFTPIVYDNLSNDINLSRSYILPRLSRLVNRFGIPAATMTTMLPAR